MLSRLLDKSFAAGAQVEPAPQSHDVVGARRTDGCSAIRRTMTDDFIELFLKWTANGEHPPVVTWLKMQGLQALPMKQGLLVTGGRRRIEAAFSVSLEKISLPFDLPIPSDLLPHVASITV